MPSVMEKNMTTVEVKVPNIGDFSDVPVVEVMVAPDDVISEEDPLIMLESDKASMEVPSPAAGTVRDVKVAVGDTVAEGTLILLLEARTGAKPAPAHPAADELDPPAPRAPASSPSSTPTGVTTAPLAGSATPPPVSADFSDVHASPAVRRLARELEIDLRRIRGSGKNQRITRDDLKAHLGAGVAPSGTAAGIPEVPPIDFSQFGEIESVALSRIQKISGPVLHRSWLNVPHVTHHEEADITALDDFRKEVDSRARSGEEGYRVTLLSFIIKGCVSALQQHWQVNASLAPDHNALIRKHYYHIGIAVDTPDGLVVPVVRDCDQRGILDISEELARLSARARAGRLSPADMSGASFTISSLGGIGGSGFTPIVNAPQVAILGVTRARMAPHWDGTAFVPRLLLPLSLSYDHRAIDGALAARFCALLKELLGDARRMLL